MWGDKDYGLTPKEGSDDWAFQSGDSKTFRHSLKASSPLSLADLDMWDSRSHFKAQSAAWCSMASVSGSGFLSKLSTSPPGRNGGFGQNDPGVRRWQSMSRLAPEGAPRSMSPSPGAELRAALAESGFRRTELVQRLREAHGRLDSQTDLLKSREAQIQHSTSASQLLNMKHKQLSEAVSALEQEKEEAELSRFEESRRRGELQDKVLQLEMDMLKMRSNLERGSIGQPASHQRSNSPLSRTLPVTQEDFYREGKQKAERELCRLREALREAEERAESLETERDQAFQQLRSSKDAQQTVLSQSEELTQRLGRSMQANNDLQDQLGEARSKLGQACLERELLSTKVLRLEDSVEDLKAKLSGSLSDKDRLLQEKADLHQRAQGLELQLERAQRGREGFTDQVCELHDQLAEAKTHTNRHDQERVLLNEELLSVTEINEKLEVELQMVKQRMETSLAQLHKLEAERVIHTNQIAALETERSQLIGEKEELLSTPNQGGHEEVTELREACCQLRESQDALQMENQMTQNRCQCLEAELLEREEELRQKGEEHQRMEAKTAENMAELRGVASHWTEKWQEVALSLHSTRGELEELRQKRPGDAEEAARLQTEVERLQTESQKDKEEIQTLLLHKANAEAGLSRVKKEAGSLLKVELDACKQELELEKSRSQGLLHRLRGGGKGGESVQTSDKGTETEHKPPQTSAESLSFSQSHAPQARGTVSLEEVDGELGQVKAELQKVWDTLHVRDSELEEQQQELHSARGQVSQQSSEVERLEQELEEREKDLRVREHALKSLQRMKDAERTESQIKISTLELKLVKLKDQTTGHSQGGGGRGDALNAHSLKAQLDESRKAAMELQQERDQAIQRLQTLRQLHQGKEESGPLDSKKEKTARLDLVDQDQQRRLVTEQLKSLFKEREQLVQDLDRSAGVQNTGPSLPDLAPKSNVVKNSSDILHSQRRRQQELLRDRGHQQGAGLRPVSEEQEEEEEDGPESEVSCLKEELHNNIHMMTAMRSEISNLKERNENLLRAKLKFQQQVQGLRATSTQPAESTSEIRVPSLSDCATEGDLRGGFPLLCGDGLFLARQVEICSPDEDEEEERKEGERGSA